MIRLFFLDILPFIVFITLIAGTWIYDRSNFLPMGLIFTLIFFLYQKLNRIEFTLSEDLREVSLLKSDNRFVYGFVKLLLGALLCGALYMNTTEEWVDVEKGLESLGFDRSNVKVPAIEEFEKDPEDGEKGADPELADNREVQPPEVMNTKKPDGQDVVEEGGRRPEDGEEQVDPIRDGWPERAPETGRGDEQGVVRNPFDRKEGGDTESREPVEWDDTKEPEEKSGVGRSVAEDRVEPAGNQESQRPEGEEGMGMDFEYEEE